MMRRNGSTLIELLLSLSAGSAVMLLAISLVHQAMTLTELSRHRSDNSRSLDQLASSFRSDVHLAVSIDVADDASMKIKTTDGSLVTYVANNHSVSRIRAYETGQDEHERFALDDASSASFQLTQNPERATLMVRNDMGLQRIPPRIDLHIKTMVGRWHDLERSKGGSQ